MLWQKGKALLAKRAKRWDEKRMADEKVLGCSYWEFFRGRIEEHTISWFTFLLFGVWIYLSVLVWSAEYWFLSALASLLFFIVILGIMYLCVYILIIPISILLLPFSLFSIWIEAGTRISENNPYRIR